MGVKIRSDDASWATFSNTETGSSAAGDSAYRQRGAQIVWRVPPAVFPDWTGVGPTGAADARLIAASILSDPFGPGRSISRGDKAQDWHPGPSGYMAKGIAANAKVLVISGFA